MTPSELPINAVFPSTDEYYKQIQCPFCILLVLYDKFKRTKLNCADLKKIANKYVSNPTKLMKDLSYKFDLDDIPKYVYIQQTLYILHKYGISDSTFVQLLPKSIQYILSNPESYKGTLFYYAPTCDFSHSDFNPLIAFERNSHKFLSSSLSLDVLNSVELRPRDNISKIKHLIPGLESTRSAEVSIIGSGRVNGKERIDNLKEVVHPFQRIARETLTCAKNKCTLPEEMGGNIVGSSTYSLLNDLMHEGKCFNKHYSTGSSKKRSMVRVIMRARNSVRGIITGYLGGFDPHFNLFLTDVTEEYLCGEPDLDVPVVGQKRRMEELGSSLIAPSNTDTQDEEPYSFFLLKKQNSPRVKVRRFNQLFVRGDGIVSICRFSGV